MKRTNYLLILLLLICILGMVSYYYFSLQHNHNLERETTKELTTTALPNNKAASVSSSGRLLATTATTGIPSKTEAKLRQLFLQGQDPAVQVTFQFQAHSQWGDEYLVQYTSPSGPSSLRALVNSQSGKVLRTWAGTNWQENIPGHNHEKSLALEITGTL